MTLEKTIQGQIRAALNAAQDPQGKPRVRLVRNAIGFDPESRVRYGLGEGSPDLVGILLDGTARAFCIEVKRPSVKKLREAQAAWWAWARRHSIAGGVARSVQEALALLEQAEQGTTAPQEGTK